MSLAPLVPQRSIAASAAEAHQSPRALVIDGSPEQRLYLTMALTVAGFDVTTLSGGATAVTTAARLLPDVICVDISLPDVAGLKVCDAVRLNPATAHIPVIVTASRSAADQRARAERAGAGDFVLKPIDPLAFGVRAQAVLRRNSPAAA